jgi:BMFP domain-containing protein YqiC
MSEQIWETFDDLFKTVYRQAKRVSELEARIADLEQRLAERAAKRPAAKTVKAATVGDMPAERAA